MAALLKVDRLVKRYHAPGWSRPVTFTLVPLVFVLVITLWSLVSLALDGVRRAQGLDASAINALVAATLVVLALYLVARALARLLAERRAAEAAG